MKRKILVAVAALFTAIVVFASVSSITAKPFSGDKQEITSPCVGRDC